MLGLQVHSPQPNEADRTWMDMIKLDPGNARTLLASKSPTAGRRRVASAKRSRQLGDGYFFFNYVTRLRRRRTFYFFDSFYFFFADSRRRAPTKAPTTKAPTRYPTPAPTHTPTTRTPTDVPTKAPPPPTRVPTPERFHIASEGCEGDPIPASECDYAVFAALPLDRSPLMNSKGLMSCHSIYNSAAPSGCTVANNATEPHIAMSLFIEPRTRPNATKMCQDRELHMCTKTEVSQHWKSLTESLKETEFLKFFAWVDDGTKSGGDAKMCMVDAAATSAGAAAEEKAAALAQPAAQEKDAPALRESAAQASSVGVTANTTNLQVKCGEKLTANFSTLCCGTVEMWDAVFNPDILGESKDCPFAEVHLCPLPSTLQPVCRGPPPTGGED